jgi:hypothetical protein
MMATPERLGADELIKFAEADDELRARAEANILSLIARDGNYYSAQGRFVWYRFYVDARKRFWDAFGRRTGYRMTASTLDLARMRQELRTRDVILYARALRHNRPDLTPEDALYFAKADSKDLTDTSA